MAATTDRAQQLNQDAEAETGALATLVPRLTPAVQRLLEQAAEYGRRAKAASSRRAYQAAWDGFEAWCRRPEIASTGATPLPPSPALVALYCTDLAHGRCGPDGEYQVAPRRPATIRKILAGLQHHYREHGDELNTGDPALRQVWQGIRRTHGTFARAKDALTIDEIRALVSVIPRDTLHGIRDRALLLIGFAGAFRRSELATLEVAHIRSTREGGRSLFVPFSKRDQEGQGEFVAIARGQHAATCPVRALDAWLAAAAIATGPVFRRITKEGRVLLRQVYRPDGAIEYRGMTDHAIALVIKRWVGAAQRAALLAGDRTLADFLAPERCSGHSLRSGNITTLYDLDVPEAEIQAQARHKDLKSTRRYNQRRRAMRSDSPATKLGL